MIFTFSINDIVMGIKVDAIQEIMNETRAQSVPMSAQYIAGLVNYRGNIITSVSLSDFFEFSDTTQDCAAPIQIVLVDGQSYLALQAQQCLEVIECNTDTMHPPLEGINQPFRDYIDAILPSNEQNIYILNTQSIIDTLLDNH